MNPKLELKRDRKSNVCRRAVTVCSLAKSFAFRPHLISHLHIRTSQEVFRNPGNNKGGGRPTFAVLVDAENANYSSLSSIMEEIKTMGADASVRRVYGDFTKACLALEAGELGTELPPSECFQLRQWEGVFGCSDDNRGNGTFVL